MARAYLRHRRIKRLKDIGLTIGFLFLLILVAARLQGGDSEPLTGPFRVVDGDTLAIGSERLRLEGIDAPELQQTCERNGAAWSCGQAAKAAMERLLSQNKTECRGSKPDRYGRRLVACFVDGGTLGGAMVASGMAVATGAITFQREQMRAQAARSGLWAGPFETPSAWRRARKLEEQNDTGILTDLKNLMMLRWL